MGRSKSVINRRLGKRGRERRTVPFGPISLHPRSKTESLNSGLSSPTGTRDSRCQITHFPQSKVRLLCVKSGKFPRDCDSLVYLIPSSLSDVPKYCARGQRTSWLIVVM